MTSLTKLADLEEYSPDRFVVKSVYEGEFSKGKLLHLEVGQQVPIHPHNGFEIVLFPQKGEAVLFEENGLEQPLKSGTVCYQGLQPSFGIKNIGETQFQMLVLLIKVSEG